MAIGLILGGWRKPILGDVARWVDHRQRLKERLSTALELSGDPETGPWCDLIVADAAEHARKIDARQLVPFALPPKIVRWALVVLILVSGLGFVPEYRSKNFLRKQNDQAAIKDAGRQLSELTRRTLERRPPNAEVDPEGVGIRGRAWGQDVKGHTHSRRGAEGFGQRRQEAQRRDARNGQGPEFKKASSKLPAPGRQRLPDARPALQKQMDALQKQLGTPTGSPQAMEKLQKDLEKLQQAAKGLNDKNSLGNEADRQQLSKSLSALSQQAQEMGLQMPELNDAIQALAAAQTDLFLKDLQASLTDLEKLRDMAKTLQQLQQQAEKMGKDLAEQLQRPTGSRADDPPKNGRSAQGRQSAARNAPEDGGGNRQGGGPRR